MIAVEEGVLSKDVQICLVRKAQAGDIDARNTLMERNRGYVCTIAQKYIKPGIDMDDLIQEGSLAINDAIKNYSPNHSTSFMGYAQLYIRKRMRKHLQYFSSTVRSADRNDLNGGLCRIDAEDPFEFICDKTEEDCTRSIQLMDDYRVVMNMMENICTDQEIDVIKHVYGLEGRKALTFRELATVHKRSFARMQQIWDQAMKKIRRYVKRLEDI